MTNAALLLGVAAGGVLVGFAVGGLVAYREFREVATGRDEGLTLCYECRSRVPPESVEDAAGGYPECPVCKGNMLPPGGTRRGGGDEGAT